MLVFGFVAKATFVNNSFINPDWLKAAIQVQGIVTRVLPRFDKVERKHFFVRKQILDKIDTGLIGARGLDLRIICAAVRPDEDVFVVQNDVSAFDVNLVLVFDTHEFRGINLVDDVLNGGKFLVAFGQNPSLDDNVVDYKCNVACKDLVLVRDQFWTVDFDVVLLEHFVERFHFSNHVGFDRIGSCKDVFE